jgi:hypothetical protein
MLENSLLDVKESPFFVNCILSRQILIKKTNQQSRGNKLKLFMVNPPQANNKMFRSTTSSCEEKDSLSMITSQQSKSKRKYSDEKFLLPEMSKLQNETLKKSHSSSATQCLLDLEEWTFDNEQHVIRNINEIKYEVESNTSESPVSKKSKPHRVASASCLTCYDTTDSDASSTIPGLTTKKVSKGVGGMIGKSSSTPSFPTMLQESTTKCVSNVYKDTNPDLHFHSILNSMSWEVETFSSLDLENFFLEPTEEHIAAYGSDVLMAVRTGNVAALRDMHLAGRTLQCCNTFGESILHLACRRGSLELVQFLVMEAGVSLLIRDDYGRTPLHDAFWTQTPQLEVVKFIISIVPDLLLIKDKRGFTPMAYARRDHWGDWCAFLNENREALTPHKLLKNTLFQ